MSRYMAGIQQVGLIAAAHETVATLLGTFANVPGLRMLAGTQPLAALGAPSAPAPQEIHTPGWIQQLWGTNQQMIAGHVNQMTVPPLPKKCGSRAAAARARLMRAINLQDMSFDVVKDYEKSLHNLAWATGETFVCNLSIAAGAVAGLVLAAQGLAALGAAFTGGASCLAVLGEASVAWQTANSIGGIVGGIYATFDNLKKAVNAGSAKDLLGTLDSGTSTIEALASIALSVGEQLSRLVRDEGGCGLFGGLGSPALHRRSGAWHRRPGGAPSGHMGLRGSGQEPDPT